MMVDACSVAFKEWAVVCAALAAGRQAIILRKGGIHESSEGFRVEHRQFWLFPTAFHQDPAALTPDAGPLLDASFNDRPPEGTIRMRHFAAVEEVVELTTLEQVLRLNGLHIWSEQTVRQRFDYRQAALFMLLVRVYEAPTAVTFDDSPYFAGCRSWVELPEAVSTAGVRAVLSDAEFEQRRELMYRTISGDPPPA